MGTGDYVCVTLRGGAPWGFTLKEGEGDIYRPLLASQVEDGSHACLAGVQEGDEVVSINGEPCGDLTLLRALALIETSSTSLQLLLKRFNFIPTEDNESEGIYLGEGVSSDENLKTTTLHIISPKSEIPREVYISDPQGKVLHRELDSDTEAPHGGNLSDDLGGHELVFKSKKDVQQCFSPGEFVELQVSLSEQSLDDRGYTSLGSARGFKGDFSTIETVRTTSSHHVPCPVREPLRQHGVVVNAPSVEVTLKLPDASGTGRGTLSVGGPTVIEDVGSQSEKEEGGDLCQPAPGSFTVSFEISSDEATLAEDQEDSDSEGDQEKPNKHRAKHARLRRNESLSEKQVKEAKSKCKRIALLLSAAPPNPHNKGVLMFKKHRQRAKKYTLVSYGTGEDEPEFSDEEDEVNGDDKQEIPAASGTNQESVGQGEQIASRDERISTPAIRTGLLLDSRRKNTSKPMFTFKEAPKVSPNPALLNLLNRSDKKGFESGPEEDYLSLGAEACNFLQSQRLKPKIPPPVAPKPVINPNSPPWSAQIEAANQGMPQCAENSLSTPAAAPTTEMVPASELEPTPAPATEPSTLPNPEETTADPPTAEQHSWTLPESESQQQPPQVIPQEAHAFEMPVIRGKGADMFAKRQSRMEKFVVDSETVEANKASRSTSPAVSLPNEWKYTPNATGRSYSLSPPARVQFTGRNSASASSSPKPPTRTSTNPPVRQASRLDKALKPLTPWEAASRHPLGLVDEAFAFQDLQQSLASNVHLAARRKILPEPPVEWKERVSYSAQHKPGSQSWSQSRNQGQAPIPSFISPSRSPASSLVSLLSYRSLPRQWQPQKNVVEANQRASVSSSERPAYMSAYTSNTLSWRR
ncbi:hypothetical protein CRENBAI_009483 [Crenichthys baileyi]|uniref:PDZ domain-containing protein n=1 Tax=Crenichthys baileyi TaxID=28760 RepID=A0AAV9R9I3_9TELE